MAFALDSYGSFVAALYRAYLLPKGHLPTSSYPFKMPMGRGFTKLDIEAYIRNTTKLANPLPFHPPAECLASLVVGSKIRFRSFGPFIRNERALFRDCSRFYRCFVLDPDPMAVHYPCFGKEVPRMSNGGPFSSILTCAFSPPRVSSGTTINLNWEAWLNVFWKTKLLRQPCLVYL
ncbi:hypothetical protein CEXT_570461 [Caerostris extrusa]|uniref:Uncharacterized protein n=1 Tax=Caerostris extrusa TaxID=172846 RepID=A0AAV4MBS9_CAEEX|nr:hypothetical protein CEXT_570461 [Caerostris extrusa]